MKALSARICRGWFPLCIEKARLITESVKQTQGDREGEK